MKPYLTLKEKGAVLMIKKFCLLLLLFSTILVSCSNQKEEISEHQTPSGPSIALKIAVLGTNQMPSIDNVNYVNINLQDLAEDENQHFDGLIISKEYLEEVAKKEYKDFLKNIKYPVFFLGTENILASVFHEENLTLEHINLDGRGPYASGFVSTEDGGYYDHSLYLPNNPTHDDKNINMIVRICNIIQQHKEGINK
ncbi:hypothetical protein SAMN05661091_2624 [Paenibacillus uliginis N3/975]|uniref:Lipoprotein n=1 Tax=Paenibacillus uliginis N3/975 TaxID=1313296 RepID=A0A1X7HEA6_9BACL|nr:hypothetical protein [Paenibacillus uliginis]SMF84450.1 hypothetical protein SAMN05661091_2624 [Paenibacillus uliginis N3/975]